MRLNGTTQTGSLWEHCFVHVISWFYRAFFAATVFRKNNAFVNGYSKHYEITYICINEIWHVLTPWSLSRVFCIHYQILRTLWGRRCHSFRDKSRKQKWRGLSDFSPQEMRCGSFLPSLCVLWITIWSCLCSFDIKQWSLPSECSLLFP
jgi:hypothetical protein